MKLLGCYIAVLFLVSCGVKPLWTESATDYFNCQGAAFVLQSDGYQIGTKGEFDVKKQNYIFLGNIKGENKSICIVPEILKGRSIIEIEVRNNNNQVISIEKISSNFDPIFAFVHKNGYIQVEEHEPIFPNEWVCFIVLVGETGIIAWNETTGGKNDIFFKKQRSDKEHIFKRIKIDKGGLWKRDRKGYNVLIEDR